MFCSTEESKIKNRRQTIRIVDTIAFQKDFSQISQTMHGGTQTLNIC